MDTQIAIIQFLFKNTWKVLSESLGTNPALTSLQCDNAPDVLKYCSTQQNCLIIASVSSKDDLIQLATFIKASRKTLKSTVLKVVVVNATENKQFEKAIAKLGSVEILEPTVNARALRFKMDFWMKAMRAQSKKLGDLNKKTIEAGPQEGTAEAKTLVQAPPLDCENDIWILTRESDCKRIIGRWMVKFMGPGPYVGQWNEVPNKKNLWAFQIKKAFAEHFIAGEGNWFFRGEQRPEFNWQENRWMMTGDSLELFFYDGKTSQVRAKVADKVLTLAGNSVYAKTKEAFIIETFDKELVFKSEAETLRDQSLEFENEGDLGGHIEGKIKEKEELGKGFLEGKVKEKEESGKGNLEGKIKEKEETGKGHLEGKVKEKEESGKGHLEGKVKEKEEAGKGHLEGKVKEKEEAGKGNFEGKVKDREDQKSQLQGKLKGAGPEKGEEKKEKEKHAQSNERLAGNWKGKLADKVEEEKPAKEEHSQHNDKISNNWGGQVKENTFEPSGQAPRRYIEKTEVDPTESKRKNDKTDHLKSHWGGKAASESLEGNGLSAPGAGEVKEGSLLGLKRTDKEHQTHYKNHNEAKQYEAGELSTNKAGPDDGFLGGKSSTDKFASHYGKNKKSESGPQGHEPLDGSGETDRVATHFGRRNIERPIKEKTEEAERPALSGKGQTDKIQGHYGSGKRPAQQGTNDFVSDELVDVIGELEAATRPKGEELGNVLPFTPKAEEKELDKITESGTLSCFITQGGRRYECKLDDYFDNNIIFICSAEGLRNSEKASFDVSFVYQGENVQVNCEGLVMSLDQDGSGGFFVTIEIGAEDTKMLEDFMGLMRSRQENIDSFLQKARGF